MNRIIKLTLLFGMLLHAQGQTNQNFYSPAGKWVTASNTNCLIWNSFPKDGESVTWSGPVAGGKAQGKGVVQWFTNGAPTTSYEGELKAGLSDGHGISEGYGLSFEGDWEKGRLVSKKVTIIEPNGTKYVGQHRNGLKEGNGVLTFPDGNTFKGEFKDGLQNGKGEETLAGGQKYIGQFRDGRFNGEGTLFTPNGDRLTGEWKDSKLYGVGTYTSKSGDTFKVKMTASGLEKL